MTSRDEIVTTFNISRDITESWVPGNGTVPNVVNGRVLRLNPSWLDNFRTALPEQYNRFIVNFNNYQQYTIKHIRLTWLPRFNDSYTQVNGTTPTNTGLPNFTSENSWITMVQDLDDTAVRGQLDEYFQARDQPNAKTFHVKAHESYGYNPFVMDTIAQDSFAGQQENPGNVATPFNSSAPAPFKWFSTKAVAANGVDISFNDGIGSLGVKVYIYTPFNSSNSTVQFPIGNWRYDVQFAFRFPDYRQPVAIPTMLMALSRQEEMNVLSTLQGETVRLQGPNETPSYLTGLGNAYAQKRKIDGSDPESEVGQEAAKRLRGDYSEA